MYGKRPYGVGLLIVGYDQDGPHLFETSPSGDYYEYVVWIIIFFLKDIIINCYILWRHILLVPDLNQQELILKIIIRNFKKVRFIIIKN